jgi:tetratricopeptide (TPR) repeat protein
MRIPLVLSILLFAIFAHSVRLLAVEQEPAELRLPRIEGSSLVGSWSFDAIRGTEIEAAIRTADWPRAERLLAAEIERRPASRDLLVLLARIFFLNSKPLNVAIALKKAEAIRPLDDDLRLTLALAYIRLGRGDWARPELDRLAASRPEQAAYRYWLGRIEYDAGQYAAAVVRFQETLARDPQFMRAHDNLGLCYEALDEPQEATVHYQEAIRLNRLSSTKSPWPLMNAAILLRKQGSLDQAATLLREALEYDATLAQAQFQLGVVLEEQGQIDKATTALTRAAELDPQYAEPHYALARIYRRQGAPERAQEALAVFLRLRDDRERRQ